MVNTADMFANFVKAKRHEKKISVNILAQKAGISKAFIYLVQDGANKPSLDTADRILQGLEESWESFAEYMRAA